MTDITPIPGASGPDPAKDTRKSGPAREAGGPSFADVLQETASGGRPAPAAPAPPETPAVHPSGAAYIGPVAGPAAPRPAVVRTGEQFLALVESLQGQLSDPGATLKDIAPLVRHIEGFRDRMLGEIAALPTDDPGRGLLEEMATLASSEVVKFHRGDYV